MEYILKNSQKKNACTKFTKIDRDNFELDKRWLIFNLKKKTFT